MFPAVRRHVAALAICVAAVAWWLYPVLTRMSEAVPGAGAGDNVSFVWNVWWTRYALHHSGQSRLLHAASAPSVRREPDPAHAHAASCPGGELDRESGARAERADRRAHPSQFRLHVRPRLQGDPTLPGVAPRRRRLRLVAVRVGPSARTLQPHRRMGDSPDRAGSVGGLRQPVVEEGRTRRNPDWVHRLCGLLLPGLRRRFDGTVSAGRRADHRARSRRLGAVAARRSADSSRASRLRWVDRGVDSRHRRHRVTAVDISGVDTQPDQPALWSLAAGTGVALPVWDAGAADPAVRSRRCEKEFRWPWASPSLPSVILVPLAIRAVSLWHVGGVRVRNDISGAARRPESTSRRWHWAIRSASFYGAGGEPVVRGPERGSRRACRVAGAGGHRFHSSSSSLRCRPVSCQMDADERLSSVSGRWGRIWRSRVVGTAFWLPATLLRWVPRRFQRADSGPCHRCRVFLLRDHVRPRVSRGCWRETRRSGCSRRRSRFCSCSISFHAIPRTTGWNYRRLS